MDDELRIFLARSKLRIIALQEMAEGPQIASFLAKKLKKHREAISRVFLDLQAKKLAKCQNPKDPHFRQYTTTEKGKLVLQELRQLGYL